ncbi:MAG: hypothetical protein M1819_004234 [Sarea resinae]|nr:MAG: hypothetical protein M1819_004234 [Sarea resinae]
MAPYDQFLLFGDSLTQQSSSQDRGFAFAPALQNGSVSKQHVPLAQYRANLFATLTHPAVERQNPRLILITPPPVDEFALERDDAQYGITEPRRTAEHTRLYADAAREVGRELNVAVLDLWTTMVKAAGWQEGQPLPGSKAAGQNLFLQGHLRDGESSRLATRHTSH